MSKTYLCGAEPGTADNCRHLRLFGACATGDGYYCHYEPWPKKRSFWCWLRRHRMLVAGYDYHLEEGNIDPIKVCQCKLNNTAIPTFVDQLRNQQ